MRPAIYRWFSFGLILSTVLIAFRVAMQPVWSETPDCATAIDRLRIATVECDNLNHNYACYARAVAQAVPASERFDQPGDRVPITATDRIETTSDLGIALMYVTTGDADPVKIVTFGNIQLAPAGDTDAANTIIVYSDDHTPVCEATPPGLVVYTSPGDAGVIYINGVKIELSSAAYVALSEPNIMVIAHLRGNVQVSIAGVGYLLSEGTEVVVQNIETVPEFVRPPTDSVIAGSEVAQWAVSSAAGLPRVYNLNETYLSCVVENSAIPATHDLTVNTPDQECLVHFCADQGDIVTVRMDGLDAQLNPWIDLRDPDQRLLNHNNDLSSSSNNALICNQRLPVNGCYTVVARSLRNETAGRFRLNLWGDVDCEQPPTLCIVKPEEGLNLRREPALDAEIITGLVQGTQFRVSGRRDEGTGGWLYVQIVGAADLAGWVWQSDEAEMCSGAIPTVMPTSTTMTETPGPPPPTGRPTEPNTPTPVTPTPVTPTPVTPTPLPPAPVFTKQSPFGEP